MHLFSFSHLYLSLLLFLLSACTEKKEGPLLNIRLTEDFLASKPGKLSSHFSRITYLPLETKDTCLLGGVIGLSTVTKDYFIVQDYSNMRVLLFDHNGKFIRQIGKRGRGPGEYYCVGSAYNANKETILMRGTDATIMEYDMKGRFLLKTKMPQKPFTTFREVSSIYNPQYLNDTLFCGFFHNQQGMEKKRIVIFNRKGEIVKLFPNHNLIPGFEQTEMGLQFVNEAFYHYRNKLYFREFYCDTIFEITPEALIPHAVLNFGKHSKPYRYQFEYKKAYLGKHNAPPLEHAQVSPIQESDRMILFEFSCCGKLFIGLYDKTNRSTGIYPYNTTFMDDINNFLPLNHPRLHETGQAIAIYNALEIAEWFEQYPQKMSPEIEKLRTIKADDNPVIVILEP